MNFVDLHNSCTSNGDHLIVLIITDNAHKERTLTQYTYTFEKCNGGGMETQSKMMMAARWWLLSQLQIYNHLRFGVAPLLFEY